MSAGSSPENPGRVPTTIIVVSVLAIVAAVVMLFWGAWIIGSTWDEKSHAVYLQNFIDTGWNADPLAVLPDGTLDPARIWGVYVYGPVAGLIQHAVTAGLGIEPWGHIELTADAYSARHVGAAIIALVSIGAVGLVVRMITSSWRWAVVGAAIISATPLWIGHGMMNVKDIPVATGYTIATLGVVALCHPSFRQSRRVKYGGFTALVGGTVLLAGTREIMGVPIAGTVVVGIALLFVLDVRGHRDGWRSSLRDAMLRLSAGAVAMLVGYVVLVAIYPRAFANPAELAWNAIVVSARFPFSEPVLTAGVLMPQPVPWTYLPLWFSAQLPLVVTLGTLTAVAIWAIAAFRTIAFQRQWRNLDTNRLAMIGVVGAQALLMPVIAVVTRSTIYNGTRLFLFVVPAVAILATIGFWWFFSAVATQLPRWLSLTAWAALGLGITAPVIAQAQLFPYNYTFYNVIATTQGIDDRWPTDYWRASSRELMQILPAGGQEYCDYESGRKGTPSECSIEGMFLPYLAERGIHALPGTVESDGWWLVRENQGATKTPDGCKLHDAITRPLWGRTVVIGQIYACG